MIMQSLKEGSYHAAQRGALPFEEPPIIDLADWQLDSPRSLLTSEYDPFNISFISQFVSAKEWLAQIQAEDEFEPTAFLYSTRSPEQGYLNCHEGNHPQSPSS